MFRVKLGIYEYKVYFYHINDNSLPPPDDVQHNGEGRNGTVCRIERVFDDENIIMAEGVAVLRPDEQCDYSQGNKIALGRAIRQLMPSRETFLEDRARFWNGYYEMRGGQW